MLVHFLLEGSYTIIRVAAHAASAPLTTPETSNLIAVDALTFSNNFDRPVQWTRISGEIKRTGSCVLTDPNPFNHFAPFLSKTISADRPKC